MTDPDIRSVSLAAVLAENTELKRTVAEEHSWYVAAESSLAARTDELAEERAFHLESMELQATTNGELRADLDRTRHHLTVALRTINEREAENAALRKDALRYRYWRERAYKDPGVPLQPELIDDVIDSAMTNEAAVAPTVLKTL